MQRTITSIRITVQLINEVTDAHLWAETYDRAYSAANVFAIQSDVASKIAASLKTELSPEDTARLAAVSTQDTEAFQHYLLGRQDLDKLTCQAARDAAQHFEQATELDAAYAAAFAGLAMSHRTQGEFCGDSPFEWRSKMRAATDRALELDPTSGEAQVAQAFLQWGAAPGEEPKITESHFKNVEAAFKLAIELAPNYEEAYT